MKFHFQPEEEEEEEGRPTCVGSPKGPVWLCPAVGTLGRKTRFPIAKEKAKLRETVGSGGAALPEGWRMLILAF